jgi:uncharacterized protein YukE
MFGADPDQLDQLSKQMSDAAERLDTISRDVGARLFCSTWEGYDAARFSDEWQHHLHGILLTAANGVRECSASLHSNAEQQRATSGDFGTPGLAGAFGVGQDGRGVLSTIFRDISPIALAAGALHGIYAGAELAEDAIKVPGLVSKFSDALRPIAEPLIGLETVLDAGTLVAAFVDHRPTGEKIGAAVDVGFDAADIGFLVAAPEFAPLAVPVLAVGKLVFDDVVMPLAMGDSVTQVVDNDVRGVTQAAKDVGSVISGGVRELSRIL